MASMPAPPLRLSKVVATSAWGDDEDDDDDDHSEDREQRNMEAAANTHSVVSQQQYSTPIQQAAQVESAPGGILGPATTQAHEHAEAPGVSDRTATPESETRVENEGMPGGEKEFGMLEGESQTDYMKRMAKERAKRKREEEAERQREQQAKVQQRLQQLEARNQERLKKVDSEREHVEVSLDQFVSHCF